MKMTAKAGDIFVTRSPSKSSSWIQACTASRWSHVGIAIGDDLILDAVKGDHSQVRTLPLQEFVAGAVAIRKYTHPGLTSLQVSKLVAFAKSVEVKQYTTAHAALTMSVPIMKFSFCWLALLSLLDVLRRAVAAGTSWLPAVGACVTIAGLIYLAYRLMTWSFRTDLGVKNTEAIFRKFRLGIYLVEMKNQLFCSKLVLLADRELGGRLSDLVPNESEVQPKHISEACKSLGWVAEDAFPGAAADGFAAR
ncbi:Permuted papain-like amidase enzyme, YaeF/YiiX, C92 family [Comamonadaceae bacterium]